ncbi:MAG TPA: hypothetical protein VHY35_01650 [Stellaceae bacterium]|nr:hypothetical protein [Stellaceae bacterium]
MIGEVEMTVTTAAEASQDIRAELAQIADVCQLAGTPARAVGYILAGTRLSTVRRELIDERAAADAKIGEIYSHHLGAHGETDPKRAAAAKSSAQWARSFARAAARHG